MKCPTCATPVADQSLSCPSCGAAFDDGGGATQIYDAPPKPSRTRGRTAAPSSIHSTSSPSIDNARFVPGHLLGERYRIVGLLGRGGMGEVYRADDLKLEQPVALKLLPESLSLDGAWLARFHREVRIARQISHRNVCRVYDIGEAEGLHFLSMEFVKGEELSSVIKRFGRLPADKATEIARQICAGLAAAHDAGVLHRDLKPANVMIDERGDARIMDFGLAGLAEEFRGEVALEGTPEYMSPEQFEGRDLTVRSDIYSLGLVLYELFTGRKAFNAKSLPELMRLRKTAAMPEQPSLFARDMDPLVERVIERCLATDPKDRPATALQVAAALPGGDPLAAALAAGETPSPEMVAAAKTEGALRPGVALALLAATLVAAALVLVFSARGMLHRRVPLEKSSVGLQERAGEVLRRLGYGEASDFVSGFITDGEYINYIKEHDKSLTRWDKLAAGQPPAMLFWYRQSPRYLVPFNGRNVTPTDPPRMISEMSGVWLDTRGRLVSFYAVPPHLNEQQPATAPDFDWSPLFTEAGLDIRKFTPAEPKWLPLHPYDVLEAWEGVYPDRPDMTMQVQAAAFRGRPVYFHIVDPWNQPTRQVAAPESAKARAQQAILIVLFTVVLSGALLLARRNLRTGRGDRRGALRLAVVAFSLQMVAWVFTAHHVPDMSGEFYLFVQNLSWSLLVAGLMWLVYVALEPFVRRRWPRRIVTWSRLLAGDLADPLVGRDILVGALFGFGLLLISCLGDYAPPWLGAAPPPPTVSAAVLSVLGGTPQLIPTLAMQFTNSFLAPATMLFMLLLFSIILRREWPAVALVGLIVTAVGVLEGNYLPVDVPLAAATAAVTLFVLLRFGLLAMVAMEFFIFAFVFYPVTTDLTAWYAGATFFSLAVCAALAAYGFYTALAGQKLFSGDLIGD